jgi:hypothetical protein
VRTQGAEEAGGVPGLRDKAGGVSRDLAAGYRGAQVVFPAREQTIFFGKSWGRIVLVLVISAHRFAVAVFVVALVLVVILFVFFMIPCRVRFPSPVPARNGG